MKNIKPIVQVMNLFSLVRINSAKSKVEEFGMTSSVLTKIISSIMYNDNIVLDKNSIEPDASKPVPQIMVFVLHIIRLFLKRLKKLKMIIKL